MQGFDKFLKNAMERQRGTADYAVVTKRGNKWIKIEIPLNLYKCM